MILYNSSRKMIGIDKESIEFLGFESIEEFKQATRGDIANIFKKKPGFVYNFRSFPWIDFVLKNPAGIKKAIITLPGKEVTVELKVSTIETFNDEPHYYCIQIQPISVSNSVEPVEYDESKTPPLFEEEHYEVQDTQTKTASIPEEEKPIELIQEEKEETPSISFEEKETPSINFEEKPIELIQEEKEETPSISFEEKETPSINFEEEKPIELIQEEKEETPSISFEEKETPSISFDIHQVSQELGVEEDFIKELIEDFINQTKVLKSEIERSLEEEDFHLTHTLIHKLKGAAANLRIEDAVEILSASTGIDDKARLKEIINRFYRYMKLFEQELEREAPKTEEKKEKNKPIDLLLASKELGLDEETIKSFIKEYLKQSLGYQEQLLSYLNQKDFDNFQKLIHKLKGTAINLRLEGVVNILDELKQNINQSEEKIEILIKEYFNYLHSIKNELFPQDETDKTTPQQSSKKELDLKKASAELGLSTNVYITFLNEFLNEIEKLLQNPQELKRDIDKLISISQNLRLDELTEALKNIKKDTQDIKNLEEVLYNIKSDKKAML